MKYFLIFYLIIFNLSLVLANSGANNSNTTNQNATSQYQAVKEPLKSKSNFEKNQKRGRFSFGDRVTLFGISVTLFILGIPALIVGIFIGSWLWSLIGAALLIQFIVVIALMSK